MSRARGAVAAWVLTGLLLGCGGGTKDGDVERNRAILRQVPPFPAAHALATRSAAYYRERGGAPLGHTTNVVYVAPRRAKAEDVVAFYARRLKPRWRCHRERIPVTNLDRPPSRDAGVAILVLNCVRGRAAIEVNTDNMASARPRFELVVDWDHRR